MKAKPTELYLPLKAKVADVSDMTSDVRLFKIAPEKAFKYKPGQFVMVSLWGAGETPISITSTQGIQEHIELCIKKVGSVTSALHSLKAGDSIGIRGPFGNGFSVGGIKGKDVLFAAGGIGIAPLRSLINEVLRTTSPLKRGRGGVLQLIYGSRSPSDILFTDDVDSWRKKGVNVILTVDRKDRKWKGSTGIVTEHMDKAKILFKNAHAFVCGPHVMINAVMRELASRGMHDDKIITTLEAHMKCGVGKCGHCYAGGKYICTDGTVFSYKEIKQKNLFSP